MRRWIMGKDTLHLSKATGRDCMAQRAGTLDDNMVPVLAQEQ